MRAFASARVVRVSARQDVRELAGADARVLTIDERVRREIRVAVSRVLVVRPTRVVGNALESRFGRASVREGREERDRRRDDMHSAHVFAEQKVANRLQEEAPPVSVVQSGTPNN